MVDDAEGAVGFRSTHLRPPERRPPGHPVLGAGTLAGVSRVRVGLSRTRTVARTSAWVWGPWPIARRAPWSSSCCRASSSTCPRRARPRRSSARRRPVASVAGSRWAWSAPSRPTGRVLLVGDAAGLVNPLQGEGIAQAMGSGRAAAEALLRDPGDAAEPVSGRRWPSSICRITGSPRPCRLDWSSRPRAVAVVARLLTAAGRSDAIAGGWSVFWNELLIGAPPNRHRSVAEWVTRLGDLTTRHSTTARWFNDRFGEGAPASGARARRTGPPRGGDVSGEGLVGGQPVPGRS